MHLSQLFSSIAYSKVCFKAHKIWLPFFSCRSLLLSTSILNDSLLPRTTLDWKNLCTEDVANCDLQWNPSKRTPLNGRHTLYNGHLLKSQLNYHY